VEGEDDGAAARRKPGAGRAILISFSAAALFGLGLGAYIVKSIPAPEGPRLVPESDAPHGSDTLELAQRVGDAFVDSLRAGDAPGAYALMARPYRDGAPLAAFAAAWRTPLLAAPGAVRFTRSTERAMNLDGKLTPAATFSATGTLVSAAGVLDTTFTFLREGGDARVLAVFVGGVPVVQGLGPSAPPPRP
jgi:hypothetical protein